MENYYGTCGSCIYTDLDEKFCGKFYCTRLKVYQLATEKADGCSAYTCGHADKEIEKARERLG